MTNYVLAAYQEYNHDLAAVVEELKTKIEALPRSLHPFFCKPYVTIMQDSDTEGRWPEARGSN